MPKNVAATSQAKAGTPGTGRPNEGEGQENCQWEKGNYEKMVSATSKQPPQTIGATEGDENCRECEGREGGIRLDVKNTQDSSLQKTRSSATGL